MIGRPAGMSIKYVFSHLGAVQPGVPVFMQELRLALNMATLREGGMLLVLVLLCPIPIECHKIMVFSNQ